MFWWERYLSLEVVFFCRLGLMLKYFFKMIELGLLLMYVGKIFIYLDFIDK